MDKLLYIMGDREESADMINHSMLDTRREVHIFFVSNEINIHVLAGTAVGELLNTWIRLEISGGDRSLVRDKSGRTCCHDVRGLTFTAYLTSQSDIWAHLYLCVVKIHLVLGRLRKIRRSPCSQR